MDHDSLDTFHQEMELRFLLKTSKGMDFFSSSLPTCVIHSFKDHTHCLYTLSAQRPCIIMLPTYCIMLSFQQTAMRNC